MKGKRLLCYMYLLDRLIPLRDVPSVDHTDHFIKSLEPLLGQLHGRAHVVESLPAQANVEWQSEGNIPILSRVFSSETDRAPRKFATSL